MMTNGDHLTYVSIANGIKPGSNSKTTDKHAQKLCVGA